MKFTQAMDNLTEPAAPPVPDEPRPGDAISPEDAMTEEAKAHRRKHFAPDEVEAIEKEYIRKARSARIRKGLKLDGETFIPEWGPTREVQGVPGEPRSAEPKYMEVHVCLMEDCGNCLRCSNATLRDQLAAAEQKIDNLDAGRGNFDFVERANYRIRKLEAALLSAQKEIAELKTKTAKLIEGLPNYSASSSMYQRVGAVKALLESK